MRAPESKTLRPLAIRAKSASGGTADATPPLGELQQLAERVGFEPTVEFPLHTLSKRAPSTTRTSLRLESTACERPTTIIAHAYDRATFWFRSRLFSAALK
jgi:hypothetical protein